MDVYKCNDVWNATSKIDIGMDKFMLEIHTSKSYRGGLIYTSATVNEYDGPMRKHRVYQDFNKRIREEKKRATEKAIIEQHQTVMLDIDSIIEEAKSHYMK